MSSDLINKKCLPCEGGVLPFDISEIHKYQKKVDGWDIKEDKNKIFFLFKKYNDFNKLSVNADELPRPVPLPISAIEFMSKPHVLVNLKDSLIRGCFI